MEGIDDQQWAVPELVIRFLRAAHELNRCLPPGIQPLTPQQIRTVLILVHNPGPTLKELAAALTLSETRASRLVEELVELGIVQRNRDSGDRRHVRLSVTPEAEDRARQLYQQRSGALRAALSGLPAAEVETFARVFRRVVEEFESLARRGAEQPVARSESLPQS